MGEYHSLWNFINYICMKHSEMRVAHFQKAVRQEAFYRTEYSGSASAVVFEKDTLYFFFKWRGYVILMIFKLYFPLSTHIIFNKVIYFNLQYLKLFRLKLVLWNWVLKTRILWLSPPHKVALSQEMTQIKQTIVSPLWFSWSL